MTKKHFLNTKQQKIKSSIFNKVIFILSGLTTLIVFIIDLCTDILALELTWQIILGLITVLSGFFTIISFCFDRQFKRLEERVVEMEKAVIYSHQANVEELKTKLEDKLSYLHDLYSYQASTNIDFKEYAQLQVENLIKKLNKLCNNGESEVLDEIAYYKKLNQLADKIKDDQLKYNSLDELKKADASKPIIWALTCFNEDEWGNEIKSEDEWSDRLEELTSLYGINVERICILSNDIQSFIKAKDSDTILKIYNENKQIKSFMGFLERYYEGKIVEKYKISTSHYAFFTNISSELEKTNGFFGICLSNGEKHIVKGDCNVEKSESTAKIVFNCDNLYAEFSAKKQHRSRLENYINNNASQSFKEFLKSKNISIKVS